MNNLVQEYHRTPRPLLDTYIHLYSSTPNHGHSPVYMICYTPCTVLYTPVHQVMVILLCTWFFILPVQCCILQYTQSWSFSRVHDFLSSLYSTLYSSTPSHGHSPLYMIFYPPYTVLYTPVRPVMVILHCTWLLILRVRYCILQFTKSWSFSSVHDYLYSVYGSVYYTARNLKEYIVERNSRITFLGFITFFSEEIRKNGEFEET